MGVWLAFEGSAPLLAAVSWSLLLVPGGRVVSSGLNWVLLGVFGGLEC